MSRRGRSVPAPQRARVLCAVGWAFRQAEQTGARPPEEVLGEVGRMLGCQTAQGRETPLQNPTGHRGREKLGLWTCRLTSQPKWSWGLGLTRHVSQTALGVGSPSSPERPRALSGGAPP